MSSRSIATKYGDSGTTDMLYGGRVSKSALEVDAIGTGDEAISALGIAFAATADAEVKRTIRDLQKRLFAFNARIITSSSQVDKLTKNFSLDDALDIAELEHILKRFEQKITLPPHFIIAGGSLASAGLDLARAIVRRLERIVVKMCEEGLLPDLQLVAYINRMSDILFILARYQDRDIEQVKLTEYRRAKPQRAAADRARERVGEKAKAPESE